MRARAGFSRPLLIAALRAAVPLTLPDLHAQTEPNRIRVEIRKEPGHWLVGQTAAVTPDSVYLVPQQSRDTLGFARSDLRRIEESRGDHNSAGVCALIGAGALGAPGIALTTAEECEDYCPSPGTGFSVGAAAGAGLGAIIGPHPCHRRAHYSEDAKQFNASLKKKLARLEPTRRGLTPGSRRRRR